MTEIAKAKAKATSSSQSQSQDSVSVAAKRRKKRNAARARDERKRRDEEKQKDEESGKPTREVLREWVKKAEITVGEDGEAVADELEDDASPVSATYSPPPDRS